MKKEFGLLFWLHLLLLIPAYLSPLLFDWWVILLGVIGVELQYWLINGCIITFWEFGKAKNKSFIYFYLKKLFPKIQLKTTIFLGRFVIPAILLLLVIIFQGILHIKPLFHITV